MTAQEYDRLVKLIADPPKGSKLAEAKEFGIDLTLLIENLMLTPIERIRKLESAQHFLVDLRRAAAKAQSK